MSHDNMFLWRLFLLLCVLICSMFKGEWIHVVVILPLFQKEGILSLPILLSGTEKGLH